MAELQKDPMTRGDFLGFGVMGVIMGGIITVPAAAFLLEPIINIDILGQSNVSDDWQEVGPVADVGVEEPEVFIVEFPLTQIYGDQEIQELSPEVPRSQEEFDLTNAVWLSWKAPILEQGDQGNSGDTIGVPERPAFLDEKRESFTPEEISEVEESLNILSNSCAHLGCPVRWIVNADGEGEFLCPCHGGIYDINGNWYGGPPPRGMYRYTQFEVRENGRLYIKHAYDVEEGIPGISTQEPYVV